MIIEFCYKIIEISLLQVSTLQVKFQDKYSPNNKNNF